LPVHTAQRIGQAVRNHWSVENESHWSLGLCLGEDQSHARIGNAAENLSCARRFALTPLKQETTAKVGTKTKRFMAGWDEKYLLQVLGI
jgi:predicted transposase YbfD/YdcC